MSFKRDWRVIQRDVYGGLGLVGIVTIPVYVATIKAMRLDATALVFLLHVLFCVMYLFCYYFAGYFTNVVIFTKEGITLQQKEQPPQQIRWEDISKIIRTRYIGGKAIVFWDKYGQEIWFYNSRKIENYIRVNQPELEPLFPEENDLRKWQDWNKKLRF